MGQVLIRNLDDHVIESLKLKAELKGHSLEQELRDILKKAVGPTVEERLAMIDRVRAMQKKPTKLLSEDIIRRMRDRHSPKRRDRKL
jgi:plasmid stability protein